MSGVPSARVHQNGAVTESDNTAPIEPAAASAAAEPAVAPAAEPVVEVSQVTVRRAPKLSVFLVLGAALGALVTLILVSMFEPDPSVGFAATYGYMLIFGIPAGLVLGAIVGLVLDRISERRRRTVTVERTHVD